jgi:phospholipase C
MWERLERREIDRLRPSPASTAGDRPRPDRPAGTDLLPQIQHIVVLMMENHSYDNYFGLLAGRGEGLPLGPDGDPVAVNYLPNGRAFRAHALTSTFQTEGNPTQTWHASHLQYGDGGCSGFASSVAATVPGGDPGVPMGYWTERDLPFYYGLARTFPLADHWFCSCLGPTYPNRRFLISGTAHGLIDDLAWDVVDYPEAGTIFDALTDHGISWVNYHNVRPVLVLLKRLLGGRVLTAVRRLAQVGRWLPRVFNRAVGNKSFTADVYPLGLARCLLHLRTVKQFFADADAGTLPGVSIVDPDFGAFSEENPQDIAKGESFAAEVINRVMHGPAWPHTLLIWLYDEHGGYYDHVPPPSAIPPDDVPPALQPGDPPGGFDRYGFRVPAGVVSPYSKTDFVSHTIYDHTSILKTVEEKWNLPALTRRDANANSLFDMLDLEKKPAFLKPPRLPAAANPTPKAGCLVTGAGTIPPPSAVTKA